MGKILLVGPLSWRWFGDCAESCGTHHTVADSDQSLMVWEFAESLQRPHDGTNQYPCWWVYWVLREQQRTPS